VNLLVPSGVSLVFAHWGEWTAKCSHTYACAGAALVTPFQEGFICRSCGRSTELVWPSADMVDGVQRLLLMRPHPQNRNWLPDETLHDLLQQNMEHGVMNVEGLEPGVVLEIVGDRISMDALPTSDSKRELVQ
jgi:hypothetical protein